jgi:hypothetical protein
MKLVVPKLRYQDGYKYRTYEEWSCHTPFVEQAARIESRDGARPWVELRSDGVLSFREGYAWDGASGPTIDTTSSYVPSLVHDGFYQLSRASKFAAPRDKVDVFFYELCVACGMFRWRAKVWLRGLRIGAAHAYKPQPERVLVAP